MSFKDLLHELPTVTAFKYAAAENPDQTQFEQDFSRIGYAFLKDKAAPLLQYLVGFETVERDEDGSRAVGIFGFKLNEKFYYVPTFFANGQIRGMDILFDKDENRMMPLTEDWVNMVVNKQPVQLGEASPQDIMKTVHRPNFMSIKRPPQYMKYSSVTCSIPHGEMIKLAFDAWNAICKSVADMLEKDAAFRGMYENALRKIAGEDLVFEKKGALTDYLATKGGPEAVGRLMQTIITNTDFLKAASEFYSLPDDLFVTTFDKKLEKVAAKSRITVTSKVTEYTPKGDRAKIVRDGFAVQDARTADEKSELFDVSMAEHLTNPTESGTYNVVMCDGKTMKVYVLMSRDFGPGDTTMIDPKKRFSYQGQKRTIFVVDDKQEDGKAIYEAAESLSSMKVGNRYILVDDNGNAGPTIDLRSVVAENGKPTKLIGYVEYRPAGREYGRTSYSGAMCSIGTDGVVISDRKGFNITRSGEMLVVPSSYKAIKLWSYDREQEHNVTDDALRQGFKPGMLESLMTNFRKNANVHDIRVYSNDGLEFRIGLDYTDEPRPLGFKSAMVRLITRYGLDEEDARTMLKEAALRRKSLRLVKLGQLVGEPTVGVSMPPPPDPIWGVDDYTGIPMQEDRGPDTVLGKTVGQPQRLNTLQQGFNMYQGPGDNGPSTVGQSPVDVANMASRSGQKNVFDHSTVAGLVKLDDSSAVIDTFIPQFIDTLDKIGRVLFLFYWKNEDFIDRFGEDNLQEMEDTIRGVFKSFGSLILDLQEKAVGSGDNEVR